MYDWIMFLGNDGVHIDIVIKDGHDDGYRSKKYCVTMRFGMVYENQILERRKAQIKRGEG